jgi:hypothetical protein
MLPTLVQSLVSLYQVAWGLLCRDSMGQQVNAIIIKKEILSRNFIVTPRMYKV